MKSMINTKKPPVITQSTETPLFLSLSAVSKPRVCSRIWRSICGPQSSYKTLSSYHSIRLMKNRSKDYQ
ncbi:unnamed protein product [Oppiella nova]|uniref:Uncharacterized protein n=1 Tax=Oppiella nova TaxID=334625 RepID=A0A7R9MUV4_9ACAR|nr:unnamed protein product [Oppiella nova]CAG2184000.1 unnamed protein product [Oppiella nova]